MTDVIVVGLGVMGGQTLWRLAHRGLRVIGIERFTPGHDRGGSHGESRIIRSAYAEGAAYVPLIQRAWRLWRELERATGQSLVTRTGGLSIGRPDSAYVAGSVASARAHGLGYEVLDADRLRRRYPPHRVTDDLVGVFEHDAGIVRPEPAVRAALDAATALGAEILTGTPVIEILPDASAPRVRLAGQELTARHVVVAAGAWLPRLVPALADHLRRVRRVMGWFPVADPAAYAPQRFPVFIRDYGDGSIFYGFGSLDGATIKVALHFWPGLDEPVDPDAGPRPPDAADAALLGEVAAASLAGVRPAPIRMKECTYTLTPDEGFLIGRRPDLPGITLLGGFSGHGFKFAPAVGETAARLAAGEPVRVPIDVFDPLRFPIGDR